MTDWFHFIRTFFFADQPNRFFTRFILFLATNTFVQSLIFKIKKTVIKRIYELPFKEIFQIY